MQIGNGTLPYSTLSVEYNERGTMSQINKYKFYYYNIGVASLYFVLDIRLVCDWFSACLSFCINWDLVLVPKTRVVQIVGLELIEMRIFFR